MGTAASSRGKVKDSTLVLQSTAYVAAAGPANPPAARTSTISPTQVPLSPQLAALQECGVTAYPSRSCFAFNAKVFVPSSDSPAGITPGVASAAEDRYLELYVGSIASELPELRVFKPVERSKKKASPQLDCTVVLISCTLRENDGIPDHPAAVDVIPADGSDALTLCPPSTTHRDTLMGLISTCSYVSAGQGLLASAQPLSSEGMLASLQMRATAAVDAVADAAGRVFDGVANIEDLVEEKEDLLDSVVSAVQSAVPVLEELGAGGLVDAASSGVAVVMGVAGDAMAYIESLAHSVPFVGGIVSALNGVFKAYQLVKARDKAVAKFVERLKDAVITLDKLLKTFMSKPGLPDPVSKLLTGAPPQLESLEKHVRSSEAIIKGMCDQNIILKFLKANQDIATLAEKGVKLGECLQSMAAYLQVTGIELQLATFQSMKEDNEALMKAIEKLSSKPDAASGANLAEIAKLMDVKEEDMKACMAAGFEALTAEIVKQFDIDIGPYRLIDNPTFRYIWKNFLVGSDHTNRDTFVAALKRYWSSKREATNDSASVLPGEDLLSDENVTSLMNVIDSDGNGKVYVTEVNKALMQSGRIAATSFEGLIAGLVESGKQQIVKKLLGVHLKLYEDRKHELETYIHPLVIEEVPSNMSLTEYVSKLDGGGTGLPAPQSLISADAAAASSAVFDTFLASASPLFLLLGEPGSGKSLFTWHRCKLREKEYRGVCSSGAVLSAMDAWIPISIDLKYYSLSEVKGLLRRHLKQECKLTEQELGMLGNPAEAGASPFKFKLLVFCDGFDELRSEPSGSAFDSAAFSDFVSELADGLVVDAKVVVTCRDRHLQGGREEENRVFLQRTGVTVVPHVRRVLIPFRTSQIDEYIERWAGGGTPSPDTPSPATSDQRAAIVDVNQDAGSPLRQAVAFVTPAAMPSTSVPGASAGPAQTLKLPPLQYQLTIRSSDSLQQIVRNPFVLRLFVDALPHLCDVNGRVDVATVTRYSIYTVFVRQYIIRQLRKGNDGRDDKRAPTTPVLSSVDEDLIVADVERLCGHIAGRMFASNTLVITFGGNADLWASVRAEFFTVDTTQVEARAREEWGAMSAVDHFRWEDNGVDEAEHVRRAVRDVKRRRLLALDSADQLCPLRKVGDGFAFLHKSFYEYFLARLVLDVGSDPLHSGALRVQRMASVLGSGRAWQNEPEAIYFLCDKWWATDAKDESGSVHATRRCLFGVVESTTARARQPDIPQDSSAGLQDTASASANAATLLNWANEPFSGVQWDGVQLAGADLSYAVFVGASLRGANLSGCVLKKAVLSDADLTGANLKGVNFAERAPVWFEACPFDPSLTLAPSQPYVFGVVNESFVVVYDINAQMVRVSLFGNSPIRCVATGEVCIAGGCEDGSVIIWEPVGFQRSWCTPGGTSVVGCVALGRHSTRPLLCIGFADGTVAVWDAADRLLLGSMPPLACPCTALCVDDACTTVAAGFKSGELHVLHVDDTLALRPVSTIPGSGKSITAMVLSPGLGSDSQVLAACTFGSKDVGVWRCNTGELLHTLSGHAKPVTCLAFSPPVSSRPQLLVTGSADGDCRLWDVASGQQYGPSLRGHTEKVLSVQFEAGGRGSLISLGADKCMRFWDVDSANVYSEQLQVSDPILAIGGNNGNSGFASVHMTGGVIAWNVSRPTDSTCWGLQPQSVQRVDNVRAAVQAKSPISIGPADSSGVPILAFSSPGGSLALWRNGSTTELGKCPKDLRLLCFFGPDSIATGTRDCGVQMWSVSPAGSAVRTLQVGAGSHYKSILALACSEGQPLLACAQLESTLNNYGQLNGAFFVRVWDIGSASSEPLFCVKTQGASSVACMSFGPPAHKQFLAVGTGPAVELWDARSGAIAGSVLAGHTAPVTALSWLSSSRLATAAEDFTIRVWDVDVGLCTHTIACPSNAKQLLLVQGSLLALCEDGVLRVLNDTTWDHVTQSRSHVAGPFAAGMRGAVTLSGSNKLLLAAAGYDEQYDAVYGCVILPRAMAPPEPEQLALALAHTLPPRAQGRLQRAFLRHAASHGIDLRLELKLLRLISMSRADGGHAVAAGNAASILNWLCAFRQSSALAGLDWCGVRLTGADFRGADLSGTRFQGATLIACDFSGATLAGADFSGVDLAQCTFVSVDRVFPGAAFVWSPRRLDGAQLLAGGSTDGSVRVWDVKQAGVESGGMFLGHTEAVTRLSFGKRFDGRLLLATGSADKTVRVWDVEAGGDALAVLSGHNDLITNFGTRSDGRLILGSCGRMDNAPRVWDVETGGDAVVTSGCHTKPVMCLQLGSRSDGRLMLASGSKDATVRLWDVEAGVDAVTVLTGHTGAVACVSFGTRSDGKVLLASGSDDTTIRLWDVDAPGDMMALLSGHTAPVVCLGFNTCSTGTLRLASGSKDAGVLVWNAESPSNPPTVLSGHTDSVSRLAFSTGSDGRTLLATGSGDKTIRLWDVDAGGDAVAVLSRSGYGIPLNGLHFCSEPGGRLWLIGTAQLWRCDPLLQVLASRRPFAANAGPAAISSTSESLVEKVELPAASPDAPPNRPYLAVGEHIATLHLREGERGSDHFGMAVSPDGAYLVVSNTFTHKVTVSRLPGCLLLSEFGGLGSEPGQFHSPMKLCFCPVHSGNILIADNGNARVQEMTLSGQHVRTIGGADVMGAPAGVGASVDVIAVCTESNKEAGAGPAVFMFDMASGSLLRSFGVVGVADGQLSRCRGLAFTPDGGHVLIAEYGFFYGKSRLSLFTLTGEFVRCMGVGSLGKPADVAFAANGDILVAHYKGDNVCVFSSDGSTLLRALGGANGEPNWMRNPTALAMHAGQLYVLDKNTARVQVFN